MKRRFVSLIMSLVMVAQLGLSGIALAAEETASPSPSPSPSPEASASPTPSASPSPSPSPSSSPAVGPVGSVGPVGKTGPTGKTGPDGPTGTKPDWVFDMRTSTWVEADKGSFAYDEASGYWLSPKYYYDKRIGWYKILAPADLRPDYLVSAPNVVHTSLGDLVIGSPEYQMARLMGVVGPNGQPTGTAAVADTTTAAGSGSMGGTQLANTNQDWFDLTNLVNVINVLQSAAKSGDVVADKNTEVGSAVTGAASVLANVINLLASAWSWSNGNLGYFMHNLFGNQTGDMLLNPTSTTGGGGGMGAGSKNMGSTTNANDLKVTTSDTAGITNNIDVSARSGDASATANTQAGDVATGNAYAQVNIMNLINSFITSGSSFFGILNIFGSLNGDVLFPDGFLDGLFSGGGATAGVSQSGTASNNTAHIDDTHKATITKATDYGIRNNINTTAASGSATLARNTEAGSGHSGAANTTGGLFNMVNSSVFGDNAVLVIVNVMGHWVGRIMNIGDGASTSALLTGNARVTHDSTGADSTNASSITNTNTADIAQHKAGSITNNVNVHAGSGNAIAADNTKVGNVTTGEAKAATSVVNLVNSSLNVSHWFGVLVINVFGDWFGSVNQDTEAGNVAKVDTGGRGAGPLAALVGVVTALGSPTQGLVGAPTADSPATTPSRVSAQLAADGAVGTTSSGTVLAAAHTALPVAQAASHGAGLNLLLIASALLILLAGAAFSWERRLHPQRIKK